MARRYPSFRFEPGRILATPGALRAISEAGDTTYEYLIRHLIGDWGIVCEEDGEANDLATANEGDPEQQSRVLSA